MNNPWPASDDARLREIIAKGKSSTYAALALNKTRSACIARARRMGLHFEKRVKRYVFRKYG